MSSITRKVINGKEYTFINTSRSNKSGFVHETELYKENQYMGRSRMQYYNRTWERYDFQSVMMGLVRELAEEFKSEFIDTWKKANGVTRLTSKRREEMEKCFEEVTENCSNYYTELKELYESLA